MKRYPTTPWACRSLVALLIPGQMLFGVPLAAASVSAEPATPERPSRPQHVEVNRTVPQLERAPAVPVFSGQPTPQELFRARVFDEPLVPIAGQPGSGENRALASALLAYVRGGNVENLAALERFLERHPESPWRASLLTNMGIVYRRTGYLSRATAAWEEAWALAKDQGDPHGRAVADRAVSELADLYGRLARHETLELVLDEVEGRDVRGSAGQRLVAARESLWSNENKTSGIYCGAAALGQIRASQAPGRMDDADVAGYLSAERATSLYQLRTHAAEMGLGMRMAKRQGNADLELPAMVHWKVGHFAAVLAEQGGRYLVRDRTFGEGSWVSRAAFNDEASGYFLIPDGPLAQGWSEVSEEEATKVQGKGITTGKNPNHCKPCDEQSGGNKGCSGGSCGMARYAIHSMLVSLNIVDTPVGYSPPRGPSLEFTVTYNQRDSFQPQIFSYANLGAQWTFDWLSYVEDDPADPGDTVAVYVRGGGREVYADYDPATASYAPERQSRAVIVRTSTSPIRYERRLPNGSKEVFGLPNGSASLPRKVLMTEWIDAQGNGVSFLYDPDLRLVAAVDAIGQVTTLSYEHPTDSLKITRVTDPFGRFATFDYNGSGQLEKITDVIGISSELTYAEGDFIDSLTTPYGTTRFISEERGLDRSLEAIDPLGGRERVEYADWSDVVGPASEPAAPDAGGLLYWNIWLHARNSFYWSKLAMSRHPGKYPMAEVTHFLHEGIYDTVASGIVESRKKPLENRVWYRYDGQVRPPGGDPGSEATNLGRSAMQTSIARVLDDGTTQAYSYEYNAMGKMLKQVDPLGRETRYIYGSNNIPDDQSCLDNANLCNGTGIDLLEVRQVNPGAALGYDLLASYTHNDRHQVLAETDATGVTTTYSYTADGDIETVTRPGPNGPDLVTTYGYDSDGRLESVAAPAGIATYVSDGYGRLRTMTRPDNWTVTYDYDALDRVTRTTYPDGTYEEGVYNRLDAEKHRDRAGRWSHTLHDALRRVVATRDPAGRMIQYEWGGPGCGGGSCGGGGQLTRLVDPNGNETRWEYDVQGRLVKEGRADGTFTEHTYEETTSRLKDFKDRKGTVATFTYFVDDQLESKTYSDGTPPVNYAYDAVTGRVAGATNGTDTLSWTYDLAGSSLSETSVKNASTVSYSYQTGYRQSVSLGGSPFVTYGYDDSGRLDSITRSGQVFGFGYDSASRRDTMTYPNGVVTNHTYDDESRLLDITATYGAQVVAQHGYAYDLVGNRTRKATPDYAEDYGYDTADQLISARRTGAGANRWHWSYGPAGNRTAEQLGDAVVGATYNDMNQLLNQRPGGALLFKGSTDEPATVTVGGQPAQTASDDSFVGTAPVPEGTGEVTVTAADASGNVRTNTYQVTTAGGSATYEYDANGNLTQKVEAGHTWTFEWNAENQLTRVTKDGAEVATFAYDPNGRRVEKVVGALTYSYSYDNEDILHETISDGPATTVYGHVHGPGFDEPLAREEVPTGTLTYYHADGLGSITNLSDHAGNVVHSYVYDAWGNIQVGANQGDYTFTAREWDPEIRLYYYRARYYDPALGRFMSEDPIGLDGGVSFFPYVTNRPTILVDPLGLYGTNDCSYYQRRCMQSGGKYYCETAQWWCNFFPKHQDPRPSTDDDHEGWFRCTRKCLQDCDEEEYEKSCSASPSSGGPSPRPDPTTDEFGDWKPFKCHVFCYIACAAPPTVPPNLP